MLTSMFQRYLYSKINFLMFGSFPKHYGVLSVCASGLSISMEFQCQFKLQCVCVFMVHDHQ